MTKKLKRQMRRIIIGAVVFVLGVLCELLPLPETPGLYRPAGLFRRGVLHHRRRRVAARRQKHHPRQGI